MLLAQHFTYSILENASNCKCNLIKINKNSFIIRYETGWLHKNNQPVLLISINATIIHPCAQGLPSASSLPAPSVSGK